MDSPENQRRSRRRTAKATRGELRRHSAHKTSYIKTQSLKIETFEIGLETEREREVIRERKCRGGRSDDRRRKGDGGGGS